MVKLLLSFGSCTRGSFCFSLSLLDQLDSLLRTECVDLGQVVAECSGACLPVITMLLDAATMCLAG